MLDQARVGAEPSSRFDDLGAFWGPVDPPHRPPRLLGLFAHPDDEVFCVAGTMARCARDGASTAVVSLTQGEAGQIHDVRATRRTLGATRAAELARAAEVLGVADTECLDLGDGSLARRSLAEIAVIVRGIVDRYEPDVVVTFGPDGAFGHPDHVTSCLATIEAVRTMPEPPRLLHARFPMRRRLLLDLIVDWLKSSESRFTGTAAFGHALKLFADGSSMLGFAADDLKVEWFPAGSYIIEQGEAAHELFCILSGSVDIVVESGDGRLSRLDTVGAGSFVGEDGIATGNPRNAHVIAREDVTCLVLAPEPRSTAHARGADASIHAVPRARPSGDRCDAQGCITIDVSASVDRKIAALSEHRSQYALDADLLPRPILTNLLGTEHFAVARFASN
jgi:LmbE family N-acetylglucosaminyl deacetylase